MMTDYFQYLDAVITQLALIPEGEKLAQALINNQTCIDWVTTEQLANVTQIDLIPGHAPQNLEGEPIETNFYSYLEKVIKPQINSGIITDGTNPNDHDERKIRWSGGKIIGYWKRENNTLILEVGLTTYPRCRQDFSRSKLEALQLMLKGLKVSQDPFFYFARGLAVTVIPITAQGTVYIGERAAHLDRPGLLNFVSGWATFNENLKEINFYKDAQMELREEARIDLELDNTNTRLVGIAGDPFTSETDLIFVVNTGIDEKHFNCSDGWDEHLKFLRLSSKNEVEALLNQGILPGEKEKKEVIYASQFGLKYLLDYYF